MNFLTFLKNEGPAFKGRYLEDIWNYTDTEIEGIHDFIQIVFLLNQPSQNSFHGYYLNDKSAI